MANPHLEPDDLGISRKRGGSPWEEQEQDLLSTNRDQLVSADPLEQVNLLEPMHFDTLEPAVVEVTIEDKRYHLKEASEEASRRYSNEQLRGARMADGKVTGIDSAFDAESILVAGCLFEVYKHPSKGDLERPVPLQVVRSWLHRVVKPLFVRAQKLSDLEDKDTEENLQKQIKTLQDKLEKIRRKQEDPAKNGQLAGAITSA